MSNLLSVAEVAKLLEKPEVTIHRYARENLLTPKKKDENNEVYFEKQEVERYIQFAKRLGG